MTAGLFAWVFVGIPLTFYIYIESAYRYALSQGKLPFLGSSEWLWYVVFGVCLASGVISVIKLPILRGRNPYAVVLLYVALMGTALFAIHLVVACGKGDCL
jgi:FtsH-binding integral membrane protein